MITATMQRTEGIYTSDSYLAAIRRRGRIFLLVALTVIATAGCLALILPSEFRSAARISVNLEGAYIKTLEPIQVAAYADQYIAELRDRVLSRDNLSQIVKDPRFFPQTEEELPVPDRVRILREGFHFSLETQPVMTDNRRGVEIISGFRAGFEGLDPEFAVKAAQFFSNSFLTEDRDSRTERASSTSAFLSKQIAQTEDRIVAHEQEIANFKVKNACCLPELKALNLSIIQRAERDIENLQPRIRTLEQDRLFLRSELEEVREQGGGNNELPTLRTDLAEAQRKYSDIHPDVISLRQRIAALESDLSASEQGGQNQLIEVPRYLRLRSEINTIDTELVELRRRNPELRRRIDDYEQRLARTPQIESEYQALIRKLETAQENFDNLQQQLVIAQQTEALESADIGARLSDVQSASLPNAPSGPPRLGIFIVGVILAAGLGVGSIFLAEMLDSTIRGGNELIGMTELVPLAAIPIIQNSVSRAATRHNLPKIISLIVAIVIGIASILIWNLT